MIRIKLVGEKMALSQAFYERNRRKLSEQMEVGSQAVIYSGREIPMTEDASYPFFANNNFYYLTGIRDPDVVLLISKNEFGEIQEQLFIQKADPEKEKWVGKRISRDKAHRLSGIERICFIEELPMEMNRQRVFSRFYFDFKVPVHQSYKIEEEALQKKIRESELMDLHPILSSMRVIKAPEELEAIKKANRITKEAIEAMKPMIKPGVFEYELAAFFEYYVKKAGAEGLAFETIAASGKNAVILHYISNRSRMKVGELVLLDLGARVDGYCGDISRTFSVGEEMTNEQEKLHAIVSTVQQEMFLAFKPGAMLKDLQNLTKDLFLQKCAEAGFIPGNNDITEFYYHGIGHPLGLDTHDVRPEGNLILAPGMVMTVEPGLYLEKLGIGIRIEDDVIITEKGCEVM
jgi:Xaa-Pro aminopeptidase